MEDHDSILAIEQALDNVDSDASDSEVNGVDMGSESRSVVENSDLEMNGYPPTDKAFVDIVRRFVMEKRIKTNSLQPSVSGSDDNSSVASFSTDSDAGAKSAYCHRPPTTNPTRMAVSDTEGSRPRKSSRRVFPDAYINEGKPVTREEFALRVRERLLAVAKDREAMTLKARDLLRQRGNSYDKIMAAQWYNLPEACKYLQTLPEQAQNAASTVSQTSSSLHPPSNHHPLSPLEVRSPNPEGSTPGGQSQTPQQGRLDRVNGMTIREVEEAMTDWQVSGQRKHPSSHRQRSGGSSVLSATSDSGVGDTWATSELTTPNNDRLHAYLQRQNFLTSRLPERERTAQAAAVALISNSPQPDSLSPLPGPAQHHHRDNERQQHQQQQQQQQQRRHMGHYSSGDDNSSVFTITSQSSTSDLFIPRRPQHHPLYAADSDEQQHYRRRPLLTPKRSKNSHTPSPLAEPHRQIPPQNTQQRAVPRSRGDTLIMYTLDDLPTPFAKRLNGTDITLKDFKEKVFARRGEYRFFFKYYCEDVGMELLEEYCEELTVLPLVEGKIVGRVEKIPV